MGDSEKSQLVWYWEEDTDLEIDHYCKCSKSHRQSRLHIPSRRHPSSHGTRQAQAGAASELSWVHWKESNSPDLNPLNLDYHVWSAMLEKYRKLQLKPKTIDELKVALQTVWEELLQEHINKSVANFIKRLTAVKIRWYYGKTNRGLFFISLIYPEDGLIRNLKHFTCHNYRRSGIIQLLLTTD